MFDRVKQCKLSHNMMLRLNNFMYIFSLRQGTILIAVHQIALSSFVLLILLVGISHVGEMLSTLHSDMEDDAERHGFYQVLYGDQPLFHEADVPSTNNQKQFAKAQHLASNTVIALYSVTIFTSIYLMCCISLLHGAVKYRREYVVPWIVAACVAIVLMIAAIVVGAVHPTIVNAFGGYHVYQLGSAIFVLTFIYAICAVGSFAVETRARCGARAADERGERLLLLDHAGHSSRLLSAHQLNKMHARDTNTHFV